MLLRQSLTETHLPLIASLSSSPLLPSVLTSVNRQLARRVMAKRFAANPDKYKTFDALESALRDAGLESAELIVGIGLCIIRPRARTPACCVTDRS